MDLPTFRLPSRPPELHLPSLQVPDLRRLPRPSLRALRLRRPEIDYEDPSRLTEPLKFFFYLLMFVAFLAFVTGATGSGVLLLVAGAALHVVGSSLEEIAARRRAQRERGERKRQVRLSSHRAARRRTATPPPRVTAQPRAVAPARAAAQPRASSARKQRVI
jgi:hypothetical protein